MGRLISVADCRYRDIEFRSCRLRIFTGSAALGFPAVFLPVIARPQGPLAACDVLTDPERYEDKDVPIRGVRLQLAHGSFFAAPKKR